MTLSRILCISIIATIAGCSSIAIDRSIPAVEAGDLTLVVSACEAMPGRGADICRVKEGQPIDSVWRLIVPADKTIKGGEVVVYYRDTSRSYPLQGRVIEIPWRDIMSGEVWEREMDGEALALAEIRFETPEGIEEIMRARGIAKIVVTAPGYDPMPIDSGFAAWRTDCRIDYSSAGRSAIACK